MHGIATQVPESRQPSLLLPLPPSPLASGSRAAGALPHACQLLRANMGTTVQALGQFLAALRGLGHTRLGTENPRVGSSILSLGTINPRLCVVAPWLSRRGARSAIARERTHPPITAISVIAIIAVIAYPLRMPR